MFIAMDSSTLVQPKVNCKQHALVTVSATAMHT